MPRFDRARGRVGVIDTNTPTALLPAAFPSAVTIRRPNVLTLVRRLRLKKKREMV